LQRVIALRYSSSFAEELDQLLGTYPNFAPTSLMLDEGAIP
jgi:hypothetical protein